MAYFKFLMSVVETSKLIYLVSYYVTAITNYLISANEAMAGVDANYTPPSGQMGSSDAQQMLQSFWPDTLEEIRSLQSVSHSSGVTTNGVIECVYELTFSHK